MAFLAVVAGEPFPGTTTLLLAALAGFCAVAGIIGLYTGLAVGRMGVVAPITGLLAATLPVGVGFARLGLPAGPVVVGIGCALVAVVLVSRARGGDDRPSGIEYGIIGGVGLGLFNVVVGAFPEHHVAWPLAVIKGASVLPIVAIVLVGRRPWRVPAPVLPIVVATAAADLAGTGFYVLATQTGRLDVAATLSSLYPVTTVVLAIVLLRERVSRSHLLGIIMAALAIVLIANGSAG
jgi:drug/metabolite transporter (DMT)-like permease